MMYDAAGDAAIHLFSHHSTGGVRLSRLVCNSVNTLIRHQALGCYSAVAGTNIRSTRFESIKTPL